MARKTRKARKHSSLRGAPQDAHRAAFGKAAKACKGSGKGFHACVRREMKK